MIVPIWQTPFLKSANKNTITTSMDVNLMSLLLTLNRYLSIAQPAFTCSNLTIKPLKGVKYVQS